MSDEGCPLGKCGGSGVIALIDYDGPGLHDEMNCPHIDSRPPGDWTPVAVAAYKVCENWAHVTGDSRCPFCAPNGVAPGYR